MHTPTIPSLGIYSTKNIYIYSYDRYIKRFTVAVFIIVKIKCT